MFCQSGSSRMQARNGFIPSERLHPPSVWVVLQIEQNPVTSEFCILAAAQPRHSQLIRCYFRQNFPWLQESDWRANAEWLGLFSLPLHRGLGWGGFLQTPRVAGQMWHLSIFSTHFTKHPALKTPKFHLCLPSWHGVTWTYHIFQLEERGKC